MASNQTAFDLNEFGVIISAQRLVRGNGGGSKLCLAWERAEGCVRESGLEAGEGGEPCHVGQGARRQAVSLSGFRA